MEVGREGGWWWVRGRGRGRGGWWGRGKVERAEVYWPIYACIILYAHIYVLINA